jgi:hypothetical protein
VNIEPHYQSADAMLAQFDRLIEELLAGTMQRSLFQTWEVEILVDMVTCGISQSTRRTRILRRYQETVRRHILDGAGVPMKLSQFLQAMKVPNGRRALSAHS